MTLSAQGEALIKHFEDCRLEAYQDSAGIWTIGWGNTRYENGARVKQGDRIPQWRADQLFGKIVQRFINEVTYLTRGMHLQQQQFDALVSFAYNVGIKALEGSTLLELVRVNQYDPCIAKEFAKWKRSGGKVVAGLIRRRAAEAHLYFSGELKFYF